MMEPSTTSLRRSSILDMDTRSTKKVSIRVITSENVIIQGGISSHSCLRFFLPKGSSLRPRT